jgi:16S rRNA processing protein RimM
LTSSGRRVSVGRVGKAHGRDGSFYVVAASHPLPEGMSIAIGSHSARIEKRGGTDERPLVRIGGLDDRESVVALNGQPLLAALEEAPLEEGEWLAEDLIGCEVPGVGTVTRVVGGPSCDVLEVGPEAVLIPLVSDAVKGVDVAARRIEVDLRFLALDEPADER